MNGVKPTFAKESENGFYKSLRAEVQQKVLENPRLQIKNERKAIGLFVLYWLFYLLIITIGKNTFWLFVSYGMLGISMILIFVNSIHDAAHQSAFRNKRLNHWYVRILEIFGGNSFIWVKRHNMLHHTYPNIQDWDIDVKQSNLVRIFPNTPLLQFHKYQHDYMFFLYPFYTLNWLFVRDFKDFFSKKDNLLKRVVHIPRIEYFKLFFFKILNIVYLLVIPYFLLDQSFSVIFLAWIVMHLVGSMIGVVALVSTHADEETVFPSVPENGQMQFSWAEHQLMVTKDFSADSSIATFLYGGFTHHVAHHLFPQISHLYYPYITPIIRKYAKEYGLVYKSYPAKEAIRSHFMLLKNNGLQENIFHIGEL